MRKRIFSLGVMALLFAACSVNEMDIATPIAKDAEEFFATIEDASTRVFVDDDLMVLWHADDRVSIFNKYTYNQQYRFMGNTGANSGSFTKVPNDDFVTGNALNSVYAIYPYKESTEISNQGVLTIDLPATQSYAENSFGVGSNTMVSCSEGNELLFKNLCGYIMLKLYGDDVTVKSISIKGNNDEPLAGKATVNATVDNAPSLTFDASATKEITLTFNTPVTLGTTAETATTFWLVVPPTTFSKGITLTVKDDKNGLFEKSTTSSLQVSRNTLKRMSALSVEIEAPQPHNVIYYTSTDGNIITPFKEDVFGASIIDNQYIDGLGVLSFDGDVRSIGKGAFFECSRLKSISIPESVIIIGDNAFSSCKGLTSVILPESITDIGNYAFDSCLNLANINIPESVTSIGNFAFYSCDSITKIDIPGSVASIGNSTFRACSGLSSINIGDGVKSIGRDAFSYCYSLSGITIPGSVKAIGDDAFSNCKNLTNLVIGNGVTTIGYGAFNWCISLVNVDFSNSVETISGFAFGNCSRLTSISLPESVTSIGNYAFSGCYSLTSVSLPESVTSIGNYAFSDCSSLSSITIPESVESIGFGVFKHCPSLMSFSGKFACQDGLFLIDSETLLAVAAGAGGVVYLPDAISIIGSDCICDSSNLTDISIPNSVTTIRAGAFQGCSNLTRVLIPVNVTIIEPYAFSNCSGLTSITVLSKTPPTGGENMFYYTQQAPIYVPEESVEAYKSAQYWSDYTDRIQAIPDFFFNGKPLAKEDENVYSGIVSLQKNESLKLDGDIQLTSFWSDPDFVANGCFNAVNGLYKVTLNKGDFTITFRRVNADGSAPNLSEGGLYLQGWGVAEKKMSESIGWPGTGGYQLAQVSDGVYQFTGKAVNENATEIGGRFRRDYVNFGYFFQDGWGNEASAGVTISGNAASLFEQESDNKFHNLVEQNASLDLGATYRLIIDFTNTTISGNAITSGIETVRIDKL